jgi:methylase of polypeptide subunit release factors
VAARASGAVEEVLDARNALGLDINPRAVELTQKALNFSHHPPTKQDVGVADARDLSFLKDNSFDLIIAHPPYLNIIKYSDPAIDGDLSAISSLPKFCDEIEQIAKELFRVLKPDKHCAILIGDTRKRRHYVPLSCHVLQRFLRSGFALKEDIIKLQHNCKSTPKWSGHLKRRGFYLIAHEHLYIFRKPLPTEDLSQIKHSCHL